MANCKFGELEGGCSSPFGAGGVNRLFLANFTDFKTALVATTGAYVTTGSKIGALQNLAALAYLGGFFEIPIAQLTAGFTGTIEGIGTTSSAYFTQPLVFSLRKLKQENANWIVDLAASKVVAILELKDLSEDSPNEPRLILLGDKTFLTMRTGGTAGSGVAPADFNGISTITLNTETSVPYVEIVPDTTVFTTDTPHEEFLQQVVQSFVG